MTIYWQSVAFPGTYSFLRTSGGAVVHLDPHISIITPGCVAPSPGQPYDFWFQLHLSTCGASGTTEFSSIPTKVLHREPNVA